MAPIVCRIILGAMEDESWTGVILAYTCPACGKQGQQVFVVNGVGWDVEKARSAAWSSRTPCKPCKQPLPENLDIHIDITAASLERLRKLGYPTPSVH